VLEKFSGPADAKSHHDAFDNLHILRAVEEGRYDDSLNGISHGTGRYEGALCLIDVDALGKTSREPLLGEVGV
jgi:hypothetical protein